jgi:ferredoxin-NADP reductase
LLQPLGRRAHRTGAGSKPAHSRTRCSFTTTTSLRANAWTWPTTIGDPRPGKHLYVCGPQGFLDAVRATARGLRWADAQVHFEYFSGALPPLGEQGGFEVEIRSSGRVVRVPET